MKKGDLKRREILTTAEQLFCQKGYQQTSVQDILDQIHTSKGSFYHHFISKEEVLTTICKERAEQSLCNTVKELTESISANPELNCLLTGMLPLNGERLSFLMMLLPTFLLPEGKSVIHSYCDSLQAAYRDAVLECIEKGCQSGEMFCDSPTIYAEIIISLANRLWVSICDIIISGGVLGNEIDLSEPLRVTEQYRRVIEKILSLPFGTLVLIDIPTLKALSDQIRIHWNQQ